MSLYILCAYISISVSIFIYVSPPRSRLVRPLLSPVAGECESGKKYGHVYLFIYIYIYIYFIHMLSIYIYLCEYICMFGSPHRFVLWRVEDARQVRRKYVYTYVYLFCLHASLYLYICIYIFLCFTFEEQARPTASFSGGWRMRVRFGI